MTEITIIRNEHPDSITLGKIGRGGVIHVYFDSGDLADAEKRIDNAIAAREYLVKKLAEGSS